MLSQFLEFHELCWFEKYWFLIFTLCNKIIDFDCIHKHLDCGIANQSLINMFPTVMISNYPFYTSDHASVLIHLHGVPKPFS